MDRISNVDQVLILLRQQLQRLGKSDRSHKSRAAGTSAPERRQSATGRIEAIMSADRLSEEELGRSLVTALLVDEFGEGPANDHKFRHVANEVYRIVASDPKARRLLDEALKTLNNPKP